MPIRSFDGKMPRIAPSALVSETACIIGDVEIGENTSIWPGVVIRGDMRPIRIGDNCHIEDNSVIHGAIIGHNVMVGHSAVVEGVVGNNVVVGDNVTILPGAEIGDFCLVGANAMVGEDMRVPQRSLVIGVPARIKGEITPQLLEKMDWYVAPYARLVQKYKEQGLWSAEKLSKGR